MSFFLRKKGNVNFKRKKPQIKKTVKKPANPKPRKEADLDEEITSDEDDENYIKGGIVRPEDLKEQDEFEEETAQEKKARLAQQYLQELREERRKEEDYVSDQERDHLELAQKLQEGVLEAAGKLRKRVADKYCGFHEEILKVLRCKQQKLSITAVAISHDEKYIFSASKDCSIVKWSLEGVKLGVVKSCRKTRTSGHSSHIYTLAISQDGKFLASGDAGCFIHIWDPETLAHLHTFKKHRGAVSGLVFRRGTHTLYSCSQDRMVMIWDLDTMDFVENLGGHQNAVTAIDALTRESCITSGGRDETVNVYLIDDEKQLKFSAHQWSVDGVRLISERTFLTCGQNGSLALWSTGRKRAQHIYQRAHGLQENKEPYWVTAIATYVNSDVVASGSMDGFIRLWRVIEGAHRLEPLFSVPAAGVVNSLAFSTSGKYLVAGIGKEHKLGRWYVVNDAVNSVVVIPFNVS